MMFDKLKLSLKIAKEINQGVWTPVWNSIDRQFLTLRKNNSDFQLWVGSCGFFFCEMYQPAQYNPFGLLGKFIVYRAAVNAINMEILSRKHIKNKELSVITKSLRGE